MPDQVLLLGGRVAYTETTPGDGSAQPVSINQDGRVRVSGKPAVFTPQTADLTAVNNALTVDVTDVSNVVFHMKNSGTATMAAGVFVFEGSVDSSNGTDGTWFSIQAVRSNANTIETSLSNPGTAAAAGLVWAYEASVNALRYVRVRCTTAVTASSIARWTAIRGSYATEPIPASQLPLGTQTVTGSITAIPAVSTPLAYTVVSAASTNAALVKAGAGNVFELTVFNPTAALIYVKFYNKASAPTVGTDVPLFTVPVPVNGLFAVDFGVVGKRFNVGIAVATTAGPLATDTAVIAAGAQVNLSYV